MITRRDQSPRQSLASDPDLKATVLSARIEERGHDLIKYTAQVNRKY